MWNLKVFENASIHMRAGHGLTWKGVPGYSKLGQIWFGTPIWPKLFIGSYGSRGIEGMSK